MSCGRPRLPLPPLRVARATSKSLLFTVRADQVTGDMLASVAGFDQVAGGGIPRDLTGARVWFTVKNRVEDVAALIAKKNAAAGGIDNQILVAPQAGISVGQFRVFLDVADTAPLDPGATYWCDAFVQLPGGPPIVRQQVMANRQLVLDPIVTTAF